MHGVRAPRTHQFMVDEPLRVAVEESGRRVDVHDLPLVHRLVSLLRVLFGRVHEKARCDRLADLCVVLAAGVQLELVPVHDGEQLLAHILGTAHGARLNEVLKAPGVGELGGCPRLVDG